SLFGANAAVAVVNLLFLPMAFLSGLWMPLSVLPDIFARLAPVWPAYHLGQIAMKVVGHDAGDSAWLHLAVLVVVTTAFFVLARRRLAEAG
ncbi:MAG: ABC transporter permease, partial [Luteimonas sp.]